jgi:hypothetical protein
VPTSSMKFVPKQDSPYTFSGFQSPFSGNGKDPFKAGSTVPVKFQLKDAQGNYVKNAAAQLSIAKITNGEEGTYVAANSPGNGNNAIRYDSSTNQYIFNLSTKDLAAGTYSLKLDLYVGAPKVIQFTLK